MHAPLKRRRIYTKSTRWITYKVKQLMRERDRLKNRAAMDKNLWLSYKLLRNKARLKDSWSHNWLTVEQLIQFDVQNNQQAMSKKPLG